MKIFFIFTFFLFVLGVEANAIECEMKDPTIKRTSEFLAKKNLKSMFLDRLKEIGVEVFEDSIQFNIEYRNIWPEGLNISASVLTINGSHLVIKSQYYDLDDESENRFHMLSPEYSVSKEVKRDLEGRPIAIYCNLEPRKGYMGYNIINDTYDDYIIESRSTVVFNSGFKFKISGE